MVAKRKPRKAAAPSRKPPKPPRRKAAAPPRKPPAPRKAAPRKPRTGAIDAADLDAVRRELAAAVEKSDLPRWRVDPDDARRSVAKLVLALVDFIRQLLERQAIRRMESGTLDAHQVEEVGRALMQLEETVTEMAVKFGLDPRDLNLDLGPLGRLK